MKVRHIALALSILLVQATSTFADQSETASTQFSPIVLAQAKPGPHAPADAESWKAVVAAANKEGSVVVYSAQTTPVQDRLKADFAKLYRW